MLSAEPSRSPSTLRASCLTCLLLIGVNAAWGTQARPDARFATATARRDSVSVYPEIATRELRDGNTVTPPGFPIGEPIFRINPGQRVDVIDLFPNDSESGYTCKVRTDANKIGFIECFDLEVQQWEGDRGELIRILLEQPYEYEGSLSGPLEDLEKFREFVAKYPDSRFTAFAELAMISLRCGIVSSLVQRVWGDLQDLKTNPSGKHMAKMWTTETNQMYLSLQKGEYERVDEISRLCSLVTKLQESVSTPFTSVGGR